MNTDQIYAVTHELRANLTGRFFGKIFQLTPLSFAFDFGLRGDFLYVNVEPASPRLYLIRRRTRDLEKQSQPLGAFGQSMRTMLSGASLTEISKDPLDRIVRLTFYREGVFRRLVVQLTGRTADLFLLDELNRITGVLRGKTGVGDVYMPPPGPLKEPAETFSLSAGPLSAQLDAHYSAIEETKAFDSQAKALRSKLTGAIRRQRTLQQNLQQDLVRHGDPEAHKRTGDLLLANIATATRTGNKVRITDYYAEDAPVIELEIDENRTLQEEAAARFRQYTKAKHAADEIAERLKLIEREVASLERRLHELDAIIESRDEAALESFEKPPPAPKVAPKKVAKQEKIPGVRRYLSTDGYEVLVGRAARDNDHLTFRVAQPNDLWMHAGDYPGSHVVIRNPTRKEIPQRAIIEAAQLAGRFSQASEDAKVVIHYTERKFLSKPKGAAPGLVRMSRFRSITVEPKENIPRL